MYRHTYYAELDRLEVVDMRRRRCWRTDEKPKIVAESFAGLRLVPTVVQRLGISPSLRFAWRRLFHAVAPTELKPKFGPTFVVPEHRPDDMPSSPVGRVEIVARNGRRLIVDARMDGVVIARLLDVVKRR